MKPRHQRWLGIGVGLLLLSGAVYFVLNAFQSNLVFFFTPTQVAAGEAPKDGHFRVGGLVKVGSVQRQDMVVEFVVTDTHQEVPVRYTGLLPDLSAEAIVAATLKAAWMQASASWPTRCWPSTMKTICPPRHNTRWMKQPAPASRRRLRDDLHVVVWRLEWCLNSV